VIYKTVLDMKILSLLLIGCLLLTACDKSSQQQAQFVPAVIENGDECHLCGMIIQNFPGPKGQAFIKHHEPALKFCSTVDLFSWLLQPETPAILQTAFVHDMAAAPSWQKPSEAHYVKATEAWYVVGHKLKGAMGHTLASFRNKSDAEGFAKKHGGRLLPFDGINLDVLAGLNRMNSH